MAIVRPGNEGVMATMTTRRAINPTRKEVRLMTWARPYANVSRFGTGREQGSHLIRVRSWESELENGFDTAPILRGPGGNVADPRDRGRVAPSVNILSGLDGCYHKRTRIKVGPSTRIDCSSEISQTFLWGSPDTGPLVREFPPGKTRRETNLLAFRGSGDHMEESIFQPYLGTRTIFKMDREILRPSYIPERLPHRESHIDQLAQILVTALKGERPSNVLIFGKTGSGKTAVVKYIENFHQPIPVTGLSTDRVYNLLREKLDEEKRVVIVALDEIDKIVQKNGDDILYQLLKINDDLSKARVSIIGISNDLKFTEYLDPRVRSRLADEKMVFPPYNADELFDILSERARLAFENGTAEDGVLRLIAALAAQEHGDARRALDLLRVSAELAERQGDEHITDEHVQRAKNKIELDTVIEAVKSLPTQSKVILLGILLNEEIGNPKLTTGEVYTTYRELCRKTGIVPLTQRRVTDLISELDMLGLVHARVRSFGRGGRTKEIQGSVPPLDVKRVLEKDEILAEARGYRLKVQTTLL